MKYSSCFNCSIIFIGFWISVNPENGLASNINIGQEEITDDSGEQTNSSDYYANYGGYANDSEEQTNTSDYYANYGGYANELAKNGDQITFDKYHNLRAHYKYLRYLVKKYPFVDVKKIGMSYEGRPIIVLRVCKGGCNNDKKAIWIDAGVHPREWITIASLSYLINELVENDDKHPHLTEKFNWHILLIANPDGYVWTFKPRGERNWRKNRNPENEAKCHPSKYQEGHGFGTDLNRNWGFSFKKQPDSQQCNSAYSGKEAFSEKETQAVRDYLLTMKNNVFISNTIHAAGEYVLIPYGHTRTPHPREEEMIAFVKVGRDAMTPFVGASYKIGSVPEVLDIVAYGGSINWHAGVLNVTYPMGMELTNKKKYGHNPPPSIIPDIGKGIFEFHKALVENEQQ